MLLINICNNKATARKQCRIIYKVFMVETCLTKLFLGVKFWKQLEYPKVTYVCSTGSQMF